MRAKVAIQIYRSVILYNTSSQSYKIKYTIWCVFWQILLILNGYLLNVTSKMNYAHSSGKQRKTLTCARDRGTLSLVLME